MDRAMQLALERCPKSDDAVVEARRAIKREIFCQGYKAAEKDLALTWEDMNLIDSILIDMQDEGVERYGGLRQYYEEALKRFNEQRKK